MPARVQSKKKKTPPRVFFFCCGPGERQGKEKPRWAPARGQSKKKNTTQGVFFFAPAPGKGRPFPGAGAKKKNTWVVLFFLLWPRAGAQRGFSFPCLSPGPQQKKTPWVVFFFLLWPRAGTGLLLPLPFPGAGAKKNNTLGGVFFFAAAPRGRSLTHCGPGWRCLPLAGVVFVFFVAGRGRTGVVFFFCCGPARTLTHSLWAGAISARPWWCFFFLLRPRRVFLDNNKNVWGTTSGLKRPGGATAKKKTPLPYCKYQWVYVVA